MLSRIRPFEMLKLSPQVKLAYGNDHCQWCWNDEQVVAGEGTGKPEESLSALAPRLHFTTQVERLVRICMPRWCGEGGQRWPPLTRFMLPSGAIIIPHFCTHLGFHFQLAL